MKMVIAVIQDRDWVTLSKELTTHGYGVTKLSSTGGFLRQGNTTIMIGTADEQVDAVLELIRTHCRKKDVPMTLYPSNITDLNILSPSVSVTVGGATIFVMNVEKFEHLE
ncbi:MAG TPA: cyclic-di-AMP receptor [Bacillota bacterium]|nr:cyclic-di-AMP receptor [Bacillota bacterium]